MQKQTTFSLSRHELSQDILLNRKSNKVQKGLVLRPVALAVLLAWNNVYAAETESHFYGKIDVQALHTTNDLFRYADQGWQLDFPLSRLGFKAQTALSGDNSIVSVYEWQVNSLDSDNKQHPVASRNTYIGINSLIFGELSFGKNDTRFKKSEGKVDLFRETVADKSQVIAGQDRLENILTYVSPKSEQFQLNASYQTGISDEKAGGYDLSVTYGDDALKQTTMYLGAAYVNGLNNLRGHRVVLQVRVYENTLGTVSLGAMAQHLENLTSRQGGNSWLLSAQLATKLALYKVQYVEDPTHIRHQGHARTWSVGLDLLHSTTLNTYGLVTLLKVQPDTQMEPAAQARNEVGLAIGARWYF